MVINQGNSDPETTFIEQQSLVDITKWQKRFTDMIFRVNYLRENLPAGQNKRSISKREAYLEESEEMIKKFNGLSSNISNLISKQVALQTELQARNNTSPIVQDSTDVVQTDFSPFDYIDE